MKDLTLKESIFKIKILISGAPFGHFMPLLDKNEGDGDDMQQISSLRFEQLILQIHFIGS